MKRKRITSLVLAVLLCVLNVNLDMFHSYAEENEREMVYISAIVNGNAKRLPAVQNEDGVLFLSGKTLSEITVYQNEENAMLFQHDNASDVSKYREVLINSEQKQANLVSFWNNQPIIKKTVLLPDLINCNDEWYFPLAEMLPLLNANAVVEDDCLYVEDVKYSMSNIMPEFKIEDYMYNSYNENDLGFTSSEKVLSAYSYLYNTVLNFDLKRLTFTGRYLGKVDSYEEILTSYLAEDETYYEALKDEDDYALPLIDYLQSDDSERISTLIDAMAPAKELADSYYENSKMTFSDYESITSMAKIAEISDFAIDMYSIAAIYTDHVDDHYQMLKSVYEIGDAKKVSFLQSLTDPSNVAANRVYATYSKDKVNMIAGIVCKQTEKALTGELQDIVLQQVAEKKGLGNGFLWSQLATCVAKEYFIATDFYVHKAASECENLGYYNRLMEQGYGQYSMYTNEYDLISHENIENMRLSAIFTLLASRSIYEALSNANEAIGNSGDIYQRKIDSINEVLKKLYLAKYCCLTDSEEYIEERVQELNNSFQNIKTYDKNHEENIQTFDKAIFGAVTDALALVGILESCIVTDADSDGKLELTVSANITDSSLDISALNKTEIMFENIVAPGVYAFSSTGRAQNIDCFVDNEKETVLFMDSYMAGNFMWISHSCWTGSTWEIMSEYVCESSISEEHRVTTCYWNHETVTEEEFFSLQDELDGERNDLPQILNTYIDGDVADVSGEFYSHLKTHLDVQSPLAVDIDKNGTVEQVIAVNNLTSLWRENTVFFNESGEQDFTGFDNVKSTIFVLDEYDGRVRIRSENFDREISLSVVDGSIVVNNDTNLSLEYSAEEDTLETNFLKIVSQNQTGVFNEVPIAELEQIAEELYLSNGHAVVSCYTYCDWEVDYDDTIPSEYEASYYRIKGCSSMQDVLEVIHQTFSSRYDDYNRGETSGDPREEGACAVTKCLSEERGLFKEVNGKVYVLCGNSPYYVSNASATYQRTEGEEVWFTMSTDRPNRTFTADFSMVYEDGVWKMGAATYARY